MSDKIQVVIVDDHPLFREGVVNTLRAEPDIVVVGEGTTADDAVNITCALLPDLILLDIGIPGNGLHAAETVARVCPVTKIVMLTAAEDEEHVLAAVKAGAHGYIPKGISARELIRILRMVHAGEGYVPPSLAASLLFELTGRTSANHHPANPLDELNQRKYQVLAGVAAGISNKEISLQLNLTEKTVKHYMTNVLQQLQVRNRVEAALIAQRHARSED